MKRGVLYGVVLVFFLMKSAALLGQRIFPSTIQLSPANGGVEEKQRRSIEDVLRKGFNHFWVYDLSGEGTKELLNFAQSRGMSIDLMTSGFERFGRYEPPVVSVYDPRYEGEVRRGIDSGLGPLKEIKRVYAVFPFLDEPFHAGPASFDVSPYAKAEFSKRYGYTMPDSLEAVRNDPRKWLDLLNFQSNTFRDGWIKVYHAVKDFDPRPRVVMTHDSHNVFGAGVRSNSKVAMDDVFHWGGDFADVLAYDIYPYMTFDYRYGEPGKLMTQLLGVADAETDRIVREGQWVPFTTLPPKMSFPPAGGAPEAGGQTEAGRADVVRGAAFGGHFGFGVVSPRGCTVTDGKVRLKMASGRPALVYRKVGRGAAYLFGFCLQDTYFETFKKEDTAGRRELRDLIGDVFQEAGVRSHISSSNPDIEASVRANDGEGYVFIINHEAVHPETSVRLADLDFRIGKIVDVESGREVSFVRKEGAVEFDIEAPFGGTRLLSVLPTIK